MEENPRNSMASMIENWLRNAGIWKDTPQNSIHWATKLVMAIFLSTVFLQVIVLFQSKDDPKLFFECLSICTFCATGALKLNTLVGNIDRWIVLLSRVNLLENQQLNTEAVNDVEYDTDDDSKVDFHPIYIQKYTTRFQSIATILDRIYRSTMVIFIVTPFVEYGFWRIRGENVAYPHIFTGWTWVDELHFAVYVGTVVFEAIGATYCVFVHFAFDLTSVGLMIFISGQFKLLRNYSELIGGSGKYCNVSKRRDDRAHFRIKKSHITHIFIVK